MREHEVNKLNNFIMGWYSEDTTFCDKLIHIFNSNKEKHTTGAIGNYGIIDTSVKDSVDLCISTPNFNSMYYGDLIRELSFKYIERYDFAKGNGIFPREGFNIQYYRPSAGFKQWHCERESADIPETLRHLVFMTYLNTVDDGGTEFFHQNLKIKAEKGLTIMWPSDWTHTHRGEVSYTKEKWIATGWLHHIQTRETQKEPYEDSSMQ